MHPEHHGSESIAQSMLASLQSHADLASMHRISSLPLGSDRYAGPVLVRYSSPVHALPQYTGSVEGTRHKRSEVANVFASGQRGRNGLVIRSRRIWLLKRDSHPKRGTLCGLDHGSICTSIVNKSIRHSYSVSGHVESLPPNSCWWRRTSW